MTPLTPIQVVYRLPNESDDAYARRLGRPVQNVGMGETTDQYIARLYATSDRDPDGGAEGYRTTTTTL